MIVNTRQVLIQVLCFVLSCMPAAKMYSSLNLFLVLHAFKQSKTPHFTTMLSLPSQLLLFPDTEILKYFQTPSYIQ